MIRIVGIMSMLIKVFAIPIILFTQYKASKMIRIVGIVEIVEIIGIVLLY